MRLIDADALTEGLTRIRDDAEQNASARPMLQCTPSEALRMAIATELIRWVNLALTIDAIPVMRCKDCKWWNKDDEPDPNGRCECNCNGGWWLPEDYCSCGERREE